MSAGLSLVVQNPRIVAVEPNDGPRARPDPDAGRYRSMPREISISRPFMSVHMPASGSDAATVVKSSEPVTAATMKIVPPRRYSLEMAVGSPIRRRSQSSCSSSVWNRIIRNRAASENRTR